MPTQNRFRQELKISGMTCDHCVKAVTTEISRLPGIVAVAVDLMAGTATVESTRELARAEVAAAVQEAGYEVA